MTYRCLDTDNDYLGIRKTDSDGTDVWYKKYTIDDMCWSFATLSPDGSTIAAYTYMSSDLSLVLIDTSDGSNNYYKNHTYIQFQTSYDSGGTIVFSPSSDYVFFEACSDGDQGDVGYV